jgi:hypothetical protein
MDRDDSSSTKPPTLWFQLTGTIGLPLHYSLHIYQFLKDRGIQDWLLFVDMEYADMVVYAGYFTWTIPLPTQFLRSI